MANKKPNEQQTPQPQGSHLAEVSPNPHNEATVTEMPVRTGPDDTAGDTNVAQTTSTRQGQLNPSVAEHVSGGRQENTSMFNDADPQAGAIRREREKQRGGEQADGSKKTKSA